MLPWPALSLLLAVNPPAPGAEPVRVGGEPSIRVESLEDGGHRSGVFAVTTPLPEGYPRPTPPGTAEIKTHPVVRRAEVDAESAGSGGGFWPLFRHIQSRGIEMTSPVEMDYHGMRPGGEPEGESWTMSFLYRDRDQGPTGSDGRVEVVDLPAMTVLAVGVPGEGRGNAMVDAYQWAGRWLEDHPEWEVAGDVRTLQYDGPSVPSSRKWSELQVPIRPSGSVAVAD